MQIDTTGLYRLIEDFKTRNLTTVATIPSNTVFEVTQISQDYKKFYSPTMLDWHYWEVPAEKVNNTTNDKGDNI